MNTEMDWNEEKDMQNYAQWRAQEEVDRLHASRRDNSGNPSAEQERQERARKMVQAHVHANVTSLLTYIFTRVYEGDRDAPFEEEDIENLRPDPDDWDADELNEYVADQGWDWAEITDTDPEDVSEPSDDELDIVRDYIRTQAEYPEVCEWYLVSDWLATRLRYSRQVLVSDGMNWYWGRQGSGQAVYMDSYMQDIADSL